MSAWSELTVPNTTPRDDKDPGMKTEPIKWPTSESEWWWMRFRLTARSKWRVLLVRVIQALGTEYVEPFDDNNCLSRSICEHWEAEFVLGEPPPEEWR